MQRVPNPHAPPAPYRNSAEGTPIQTLRVMTYNVHSCRGTDRRHDPARIAEVIAHCRPDVVALQEVDVGRARSGGADQAQLIAAHLRMTAHFHPALHVREEQYGDAILTALPSNLVRVGSLPSIGELRGAIWVEIAVGMHHLQVINTHLGLRTRDRLQQAEALIAPEWLGDIRCRNQPTLFVGDLNSVPSSAAFRRVAERINPVRSMHAKPPGPTFPSRLPLLRLDHVFANHLVEALDIGVVDTPLARKASDHLPLLATVGLHSAASTRGEPVSAAGSNAQSETLPVSAGS